MRENGTICVAFLAEVDDEAEVGELESLPSGSPLKAAGSGLSPHYRQNVLACQTSLLSSHFSRPHNQPSFLPGATMCQAHRLVGHIGGPDQNQVQSLTITPSEEHSCTISTEYWIAAHVV